MKSHILYKNNNRVILLFAGWAMDSQAFASVRVPGYDIAIVWDYTNMTFEADWHADYQEIIVVGWSMGVLAAERFIAENTQLPITKTIVVAGSPTPRHDSEGIPCATYDATLLINSAPLLLKFYRRVAGGTDAMKRLLPELPQRDPAEAQAELQAITARLDDFAADCEGKSQRCFNHSLFDEIIIGGRDLIFPADNLLRAWQSVNNRVTVDPEMAHLPDFGALLRRLTINKGVVKEQFAAVETTYDDAAEIQSIVAKNLATCIPSISNADILEIGAGSGLLTKLMQQRVSNCRITTLDLTPTAIPSQNGNTIATIEGDAELTIRALPDESVDMVVSSSTIQWFNSPRRFLEQVARVLRPGGKACIATFGAQTLTTISEIAPDGALHYSPIELPEGVEGDITSQIITLSFPSATEALRHLQLTGVNGSRRSLTSVASMKQILKAICDDNGRSARLSFEEVTITFTKKAL